MCPKCQQAIFCITCLDKIKGGKCPVCQQKVQKKQYWRNRPLENIFQKRQLARRKDYCEKHDMSHAYFDTQCNVSLCPDCYIDSHLGHKKTHLRDAFAAAEKKVRDGLDFAADAES